MISACNISAESVCRSQTDT